jgi:hypothetical protein
VGVDEGTSCLTLIHSKTKRGGAVSLFVELCFGVDEVEVMPQLKKKEPQKQRFGRSLLLKGRIRQICLFESRVFRIFRFGWLTR